MSSVCLNITANATQLSVLLAKQSSLFYVSTRNTAKRKTALMGFACFMIFAAILSF